MKKIVSTLFALLLVFVPLVTITPKAQAYNNSNYYSFSGLEPMEEITVAEIDHNTSFFVSPDGNDNALGTKVEPLRTLARARRRTAFRGTSQMAVLPAGHRENTAQTGAHDALFRPEQRGLLAIRHLRTSDPIRAHASRTMPTGRGTRQERIQNRTTLRLHPQCQNHRRSY